MREDGQALLSGHATGYVPEGITLNENHQQLRRLFPDLDVLEDNAR
jgi:hypothetical protein